MNHDLRHLTPGTDSSVVGGDPWSQVGTDMARGWEDHLVPLFRPWAERLVAVTGPARGERVLDVGCSTGLTTGIAARYVGDAGTVGGVDIAPGMIAVARATYAETHPAITWKVGDAHHLPYPDDSVDVVLSNQGLQFFTDPLGALNEANRVLVDGGRLGLEIWRPMEHQHDFRRLVEALEQRLSPKAGALRYVTSSWQPEDINHLLVEAGFAQVNSTIDSDSIRFESVEDCLYAQASGTPLGAAVSTMDTAARQRLVRALVSDLDDLLDDDGLSLTMTSYLVVAHVRR